MTFARCQLKKPKLHFLFALVFLLSCSEKNVEDLFDKGEKSTKEPTLSTVVDRSSVSNEKKYHTGMIAYWPFEHVIYRDSRLVTPSTLKKKETFDLELPQQTCHSKTTSSLSLNGMIQIPTGASNQTLSLLSRNVTITLLQPQQKGRRSKWSGGVEIIKEIPDLTHIVLIYNKKNNQIRIYKNSTSQSKTVSYTLDSSIRLHIKTSSKENTTIRNIMLWNRELKQSELKQLFDDMTSKKDLLSKAYNQCFMTQYCGDQYRSPKNCSVLIYSVKMRNNENDPYSWTSDQWKTFCTTKRSDHTLWSKQAVRPLDEVKTTEYHLPKALYEEEFFLPEILGKNFRTKAFKDLPKGYRVEPHDTLKQASSKKVGESGIHAQLTTSAQNKEMVTYFYMKKSHSCNDLLFPNNDQCLTVNDNSSASAVAYCRTEIISWPRRHRTCICTQKLGTAALDF